MAGATVKLWDHSFACGVHDGEPCTCKDDFLPMVAALYVQKDGAYFGLDGVDPWDEARDARQYAGPWPVVAHPPCQRWSIAASIHMRTRPIGDDGDTFAHALDTVRRFGGVLEHPAGTRAWRAYGLMRPPERGWGRSLYDDGWVCQIDQAWFGLPFRKPTWLYVAGVDDPPAMPWGLTRGRSVLHFHGGGTQHLRSVTPDPFRDVLLGIARSALPSFDILPATRSDHRASAESLTPVLHAEPPRDRGEAAPSMGWPRSDGRAQ